MKIIKAIADFARVIWSRFSLSTPETFQFLPEKPITTRNIRAANLETMFGKDITEKEVLLPIVIAGQETQVLVSRDAGGKLEMRTAGDYIRRSKPNGVSASASGGFGLSTVSGRVSQDTDAFRAGIEPFVVFSKSSYWKNFVLSDNISLEDLRKVPLDRISELLAVVSPEVSNGLYIRTIFSNSGYEIKALKLDKDEIDERAQKELDAMREIVAKQNGTEDVFFNRLFNTYFMRGAILSEVVFEENGRDFAGIVTPDPSTLQFRRIAHPVLGTVWDFGQLQNGKYVSLNVETISYVPLNPFTDSIEGQPLISSSFFIAVFMMAVLRDFKRVIQQQGYPRYDVEIELEKLLNLMPSDAKQETPEGEQKFQAWAKELFETTKNYIKNLTPDDTFVHFTGVKVNQPVGAMGTNALTSIDGLFKGLERMASRALKIPPIFSGITDGVSEANANRQFEAFISDIGNGQHAIENSVGGHYQLGLTAKGIRARVQIRFAQNRSSERLRDGQADNQEAQNAKLQYEMGWISQDEAARRGAKVEKADAPEPRQIASGNGNNIPPQLDNGVNRLLQGGKLRVPTVGELNKAKEIFQSLAPEPAQDLIFADKTEN